MHGLEDEEVPQHPSNMQAPHLASWRGVSLSENSRFLVAEMRNSHEFARTGDPATSKKPKAPKKRKADDVLEKMAPLPTIPKAKPAGGAKKGKIAVAAVGSSKPKPKVDVEEKEDASPKIKMELLLANKFDLEKKKSPTGYWISEKCAHYHLVTISATLTDFNPRSGRYSSVLGWRVEDLLEIGKCFPCSQMVHRSSVACTLTRLIFLRLLRPFSRRKSPFLVTEFEAIAFWIASSTMLTLLTVTQRTPSRHYSRRRVVAS